jgi:hypothetical protein
VLKSKGISLLPIINYTVTGFKNVKIFTKGAIHCNFLDLHRIKSKAKVTVHHGVNMKLVVMSASKVETDGF